MTQLRLNVLSNLIGTGWLALVQLLIVPAYLHLLGVEGYGVIGFYLTLQGTLRILDLGLSSTVNRELARYSVSVQTSREARDFALTFEALYWAISLVLTVVIWMAAPALVRYWLQANSISVSTLEHAVRSMGILAALQWPVSFYQGGLSGLERQPLLNVIRGGMTTMMALAGFLVLYFIAAEITLFFWSQIAVAVIHVIVMRVALWRNLPPAGVRASINPALVLGVRRFAAGVTGITVCSVVLAQADKIMLSKSLTLEMFGYYTVASVGATALGALYVPIFNAMFPRLTALVAQGHEASVRPLFRLVSQFVAVATVPAALIISMFAPALLMIWTRDAATTANAAPLLAILVIGTALNGLMYLPYALQLAYGWTRLAFSVNLALVAAMIPGLLIAVRHYGAIGAAVVWTAVNLFYVLVGIPVTHRRLFGDSGAYWFGDLAAILGASLTVVGSWWLLALAQPSPSTTILILAGAALTGTLAALAVSTQLREWTLSYLVQRFGRFL
jgi:O-antigen/teichoic acid export membrane protein